MSKKKFTTGLESLFGDSSEEAFKEESPLMDVEEKPKERRIERAERKKRHSTTSSSTAVVRKISSKDFTSDLESLFEEALNETIEEKVQEVNREEVVRRRAKRPRRVLSGLDALIRNTTDMEYVEVNVPSKKRVTFVFEKKKLERLKSIAKSKKLYLKDIIGDVMSKYIEKYESEKDRDIA